jgi:hypothetical protein
MGLEMPTRENHGAPNGNNVYRERAILQKRIAKSLKLIMQYGQIDGAHHKQWVIDQVARALTGDDDSYSEFVFACKDGKDGPETYPYDTGIAP